MQKGTFRTGITEEARGFVGQAWSINSGVTNNGRKFLEFDIFCGMAAPEYNQIPTVRHVVVYGDDAELNKGFIRQGAKVYVRGWVKTHEYLTKDGQKRKMDRLVVDERGGLQVIEDIAPAERELESMSGRQGCQP